MTTSAARQLLRDHPLLAFFVLTYVLTWALVLPFGVFFTAGPLLAAVTVVALTRGRAGFAELAGRMLRWRVGAIWYALAVAVPVGVQCLTFGINLSLGAGTPTSLAQLAPLSILGAFAVRLVNPLDGPLAEEPGWRAFAQPRMQLGRTRLGATLILAVLVASWHLPLWLLPEFGATPGIIVADILGTIAVTVWYAWLFNHSGGSGLLTLIAHSTEGLVHPQLFWSDPALASQATSVYSAVWCLAALVLLVADWQFWTHRSDRVEDTGSAATTALPGVRPERVS
ncbi:MAG TPA: CPBP family glutamic-type intramembrane protease [Propionibacteriaceae bacterium]|jgi:membrane protease YdiL (CAAX protease family)